MSESQYFAQRDQKNEEKLKAMLSALPSCSTDFFRGIEPSTSSMTRLSYAYDLTMFFHFLKEIKEEWKEIPLEQLQTEALSQISVQDIERYLEDLKYRPNDPEHKNMNREQGIKRKFFSLKSFFGYLCRVGLLTVNPTLSMQMPRTHAKEIVRLDSEEMKELLAEVDSGSGLSGRQKAFHERTRLRDSALLALMLGTGIRVSECVGLNLDDVDMKESGIHIRRKGGKETTVYFNAEVARRLNEYLSVRTGIETLPEHKNALFLSLRNQRITVRSVEYLVKKYASIIAPKKKITPHKLRSSYGSAVYKETNDIYLVADILGHNDVNITRKFYAAIEEDRRKSVKNLDIL